jgi:hypothetical protein
MRKLSILCWFICAICSFNVNTLLACQLPPDHNWYANAVLEEAHTETIQNIGYCQGVSSHNNFYYFYGDDKLHEPRMGIIRECELIAPENRLSSVMPRFKETGRVIKLTQHNKPLILHPTGLTWDETHGCYLGDTVNKVATIYKLDWEQALKDGNLDQAILQTIKDNAAINGCRPCFVQLDKTFLATADYGNATPRLRLYDPAKLSVAKETLEPGVLVKQFPIGSFNQNLSWDNEQKHIICIQNVIEGRGWQLEYLDLKQMLDGWDSTSAVVKHQRLTFPPHDELEGFCILPDGRQLFCTSSIKENVTIGKPLIRKPFISDVKTDFKVR